MPSEQHATEFHCMECVAMGQEISVLAFERITIELRQLYLT